MRVRMVRLVVQHALDCVLDGLDGVPDDLNRALHDVLDAVDDASGRVRQALLDVAHQPIPPSSQERPKYLSRSAVG
jgi:hypothetical protein